MIKGNGNLNPDLLVEQDIVFVTFNHRVGMLGFMTLGTSEYSGNMGIKDQQLALKWVYENIDAFGGDKTQVTISGHSSGALRQFISISFDSNILHITHNSYID